MESFDEIIESLAMIESDTSVPRNVRVRIKSAMDILGDSAETNIGLKVDKSIEELHNVADDPNVPQYTKMQIWSVVSQLGNR